MIVTEAESEQTGRKNESIRRCRRRVATDALFCGFGVKERTLAVCIDKLFILIDGKPEAHKILTAD